MVAITERLIGGGTPLEKKDPLTGFQRETAQALAATLMPSVAGRSIIDLAEAVKSLDAGLKSWLSLFCGSGHGCRSAG